MIESVRVERGSSSSLSQVPRPLIPTDPRNPPPSSLAARAVMRANRPAHTGPEIRLGRALRQAHVTGYRRNAVTPAGRADLTFRAERVAIFVHGCFWHRCPTCRLPLPKSHREFWSSKFRRNRLRDARVRSQLRTLGWVVVEIWDHELTDAPRVARTVGRVIARRRGDFRIRPMERF